MEFLEDANDPMLKPRLLRSLVRDRLPDEKRSLQNPSQLSSVLSLVRVHDLLSESLPQKTPAGEAPGPDKLARAWGAAVDAWVELCLALSSSKMPDKRWEGICLLGLTFETCASDRFLRSYSVWFEALLSNIQPSEDSRLVKLASCASMSDLFTRLSCFANAKKDATSLASKLSQPVLQLLSDDGTDDTLVGALDLLGSLLNLFPFSFHHHYEKVEAVIVSKIMSEKYNADISEVRCKASLTKVKGDEEGWITMMHKLLISVSVYLTNAFRGLEEESRSAETMRLLVPPGKEPPPSLGGQSFSSATLEQSTKKIQEVPVPCVYTLMRCCCIMITSPYPTQATLPVHPLISLVERVLSVDGSLHETRTSFTSELHQELICSELPSLHLNCLDLLTAVIKALRSQLLPHAATITRILTECLKRATSRCLRIKVYSIMQAFMKLIYRVAPGSGMALYLADDIIKNAFADLNSNKSNLGSSNLDNSKEAQESMVHPSSRKRKHVSSSQKEKIGADPGKETVTRKTTTSLSIQIAALGTLEALITMAGSLKAECWRQDVDQLLMTVAADACSAGWASEKKNHMLGWESSPTRADLQLAALQALLASLLSHAYVRPPYLAQGLELFRRGKQEIGTKVAAFCTHAMLALEVLIHPRSLPLIDFPAMKNSGFNASPATYMLPSGQKSNLPPCSRGFGLLEDDLYDSWLDSGEETAVGVTHTDEHVDDVGMFSREVEEPCPEQVPAIISANAHQVVDGSTDPKRASDMDTTSYGQHENLIKLRETGESNSKDTVDPAAGDKALTHQGAATSDVSDSKEMALVVGRDHAVENTDVRKDDTEGSLIPEKGKMMFNSNSPSLDSLPDIVDADPDSD
ncbi:hypothetical protein Taro_036277 [Colocasia esculenta]|uniref:Pre-rRNA-processing protein RIX1 N-terminal domain-containing protein n=1 Tax=Colocasia esculenta TaxID=4460 RepID=A0A843WHD5_COLES|nr:hypothetical protein [Colocasia esculenta]